MEGLDTEILRPRSIMKFYLLLVFSFCGASREVSPPTYEHRDPVTSKVYQCEQCPPGTAVLQHCGRDTPTACGPCPEGHFSEHWHWGKACQRCTAVCKEQQLVQRECTRTHDRLCECAPGYHLEVEFCVKHTLCPPGSGATTLGTPEGDTECERCARGFFSGRFSATEPCEPHRNCSRLGLRTLSPGTAEKNSVCEHDDRAIAPECFQQDLQCHTDVMLCEEVILQFLSSLHFLSALPLHTVAASLPGRKLDSTSVEQVNKTCSPKQQVLQLLILWRERNKHHRRLFGITKGVKHCEKVVSRSSAFRKTTLSDLQMMTDSLPGAKVREEDVRGAMESCQPQQYLLKVLYLWKTQNEEQDLAKALALSLRELRTRGAPSHLLRSMRRLNTLFSTSSIRKLYKNIFLNIILDKC
ncbi:tumor necrosis factor receptor superfamily member 11B-like isoform X1 [Anguilla anguilla]|uniref:tumor necrosis factor receptor superfamily member 11B-like isoform X1 n=1 Tax=Anguilla anguilla TaxID=7936 RepID=UPI0015A92062|nr:tumor necrosis factor receptor superfamily member 11B-like isoform X1 [Anguilla anguilla]